MEADNVEETKREKGEKIDITIANAKSDEEGTSGVV